MEYRQFWQAGLQVSAIGFGCWEMGGGYGAIGESEMIELSTALWMWESTALIPPKATEWAGQKALLAEALGNRRKDVIIATKFGILYERQ